MKLPILTLIISVVLSAIFFLFGPMPEELIWQSHAGVSWQLITTHFVHIGTEHFVWNLVAFIFLGGIVEQYSKKLLIYSLAIGVMFVSFYLLSFFSLPAYAGLSGVLNTLLVIVLFKISHQTEYRTAAIISFIASLAKILFERTSTTAIFSSLLWPSVPAAHFSGILAGLVFCLVLTNKKRLSRKPSSIYSEIETLYVK